ncbi:MAG: hypothetical protein ACJAUH_000894 [Saprospiraceae bacterium]|jgi:hypothetical protein
MSKAQRISFQNFLNRFEEVSLPISIGTETHLDFSSQQNPLPVAMIDKFFIETGVMTELDEFTELVPLMKIADTTGFHALIVWKAGLLNYEYWMLTFDDMEQLIDKKSIAGTKVMDNLLLHAVVSINEQREIHVMESGRDVNNEKVFDPTKSLRYQFQLLEDGYIQEEEPDDLF